MNVKTIKINAAIFPKVIQIILGKPQPQKAVNDDVDAQHIEPDLIIDLPRSAYLTYLQSMASEGSSTELELLKKYANGFSFSDSEFEEAIKLILFTGGRNHRLPATDDILAPFGICIDHDDEKRKLNVINSEKSRLRAETWEYILIDILEKPAFEIIECFDFATSFNCNAACSAAAKLANRFCSLAYHSRSSAADGCFEEGAVDTDVEVDLRAK